MSRVMIVFENVPEDTDIYVIDGVSQEDLQRMLRCHYRFTNVVGCEDVQEDLDWLAEFLLDHSPVREPASGHFDAVIVTGFLM